MTARRTGKRSAALQNARLTVIWAAHLVSYLFPLQAERNIAPAIRPGVSWELPRAKDSRAEGRQAGPAGSALTAEEGLSCHPRKRRACRSPRPPRLRRCRTDIQPTRSR